MKKAKQSEYEAVCASEKLKGWGKVVTGKDGVARVKYIVPLYARDAMASRTGLKPLTSHWITVEQAKTIDRGSGAAVVAVSR